MGSLLLVSNLGTRPATSLSFLTSYWLDAAEGTNYIKATNPWGPTVLLLPSPIMILMIDPVGSNGLLLCKLYRISGFSILRPSPDWSCRKQTRPQITVDYIYIYNPVLSRVLSRIPDLASMNKFTGTWRSESQCQLMIKILDMVHAEVSSSASRKTLNYM